MNFVLFLLHISPTNDYHFGTPSKNGIAVSMGSMNTSHFWGFFFEAIYFTNGCNTSHCILLHNCDKIPVKWVMAKAIILCEGDSSTHPRFVCMASATHIKNCVRNPGISTVPVEYRYVFASLNLDGVQVWGIKVNFFYSEEHSTPIEDEVTWTPPVAY